MKKKTGKSAYAKAGVDIDVKMNALSRAKKMIQKTMTPGVIGNWGSFGGLFKSPGKDMVLVSSADGVGTKLKVALMAQRHDTVGQDIVNHCVNDILVQGAYPLFFLDYFGASRIDEGVFAQIIEGLCKACRENACALIGGETAEMPGLYPKDEYDLVGTIVGAVEKKKIITGKGIRAGDVLIGLPSSGLHTNGYSLARRVIFEQAKLKVNDRLPGTKQTVAEALLAVHKSYLKPVRTLMDHLTVQGLAHITGGGFPDNIPRVLPEGLCAVIDRSTWKTPALFAFIQEKGNVDREEMYRVFNMGIGMVVIVREDHVVEALEVLKAAGEKPLVIGWMEKGPEAVRMMN
ncbi:MAG TPA: phosphoribosylformylglycinamidine cyclo-ligase [Verrucomicrobia bacterium]|nr:MAG: phosphoribosylformylglycinamidine cyclo-ligase [Lentisphaerae bacterium GWF2_57_35]HBA83773.1 phosphoribosylformylglycinamidine cyclo-ligase [Verrucomicrobiota bacterium]